MKSTQTQKKQPAGTMRALDDKEIRAVAGGPKGGNPGSGGNPTKPS